MSSPPTVGRIVHYRTYDNARQDSRCVPAIVSEVHEEQKIGLHAFLPSGTFLDRNVRHDEDQDDATWHWPCVITEETE